MADIKFWRDLRRNFETLDDDRDFHVWVLDSNPALVETEGGHRGDQERREALHEGFRNFATRGAIALGAKPEDGFTEWVAQIRRRLPHRMKGHTFHEYSSGDLRDVPFARIIPPDQNIKQNRRISRAAAAETRRRKLAGLPDPQAALTFVLEPLGDRYIITEGRELYDKVLGLGKADVKCYVGPSVRGTTSGGTINSPKRAAIELCELLETDATVPAHVSSGGTPNALDALPADEVPPGRQPSNRERVDAYLREVLRASGLRVTRKELWSRGYSDASEFQRWQRDDPRTTAKARAFFEDLLTRRPHLQ